jgi:hypothetical protein
MASAPSRVPGRPPTVVDTTALAQRLHRAAQTENGTPRDAWTLARRLAGYLHRPRVGSREELAFCRLEGGRIGVSRFRGNRRGQLKDFIMLSFEPGGIPARVWKQLSQLAAAEFVATGKVWQTHMGGRKRTK